MKKLISNNERGIFQFILFSLIGVLNTLIHYAIFIILFRVFDINYLVASGVGYFVGMVNSYFLNRRWTFISSNNIHPEFTKFILVNVISMSTNLIVLKFSVTTMGLIPEVGQIISIIFSISVNFFGNKFWTFNSSYKYHSEL